MTQTMLTTTTLKFLLVTIQQHVVVETYKPAKMNRAVRTSCCLRVVRRRHSSGIGCGKVNSHSLRGWNMKGTYEREYHKVESDIDGAATNEESINVEAVTMEVWVDTVPGVVDGMTACVSFCSESRGAELAYH